MRSSCVAKMAFSFDGENLLEGRRILPSPNPPRAVDSADCATRIAVSASVGHTLSAGVRVDPGAGRNRGRDADDRVGRFHRHARSRR